MSIYMQRRIAYMLCHPVKSSAKFLQNPASIKMVFATLMMPGLLWLSHKSPIAKRLLPFAGAALDITAITSNMLPSRYSNSRVNYFLKGAAALGTFILRQKFTGSANREQVLHSLFGGF